MSEMKLSERLRAIVFGEEWVYPEMVLEMASEVETLEADLKEDKTRINTLEEEIKVNNGSFKFLLEKEQERFKNTDELYKICEQLHLGTVRKLKIAESHLRECYILCEGCKSRIEGSSKPVQNYIDKVVI